MKDDIKNATKLETKICTRCGGTGKLEHFGHVHGGTCFKCGGAKSIYTKRGAAALAFLTASRSKPCEQIVAGDKVRALFGNPMSGQVSAFATVTESVQATDSPQTANGKTFFYWKLELSHPKFGGLSDYKLPGSLVRVAQSAEAKAATFKAALEFQATLTKSGTVRTPKA